MKKLLVTQIAIMMMISAQSHAFYPGFQSLKKKLETTKQVQMKKKKVSNTCANFNGDWVGTCVEDGVKGSKEMSVVQEEGDCMSIEIFDDNFELTGQYQKSENSSGVFGAMNVALSSQWNTDQTAILFKGTILFSSAFLGSQNATIDAQVMYDGAELVTFTKVIGNFDGPKEISCRLSKK